MSRVAVKESVLRWAVERAGFNLVSLKNTYPKIQQWATGDIQPTLKQLEGLAKKTHTPLGFLFLDSPPEDTLPIPHFREVKSGKSIRPSPDLIDTVFAMQRRQNWMREYLIEQGQDALSFVNSAKPGIAPAEAADRLRRALQLDEDWASHQNTWTDALGALREAMESAGIMVVVNGVVGNNTHRKLVVSEFRGFVLVDEYSPLVFLNGADGKAAQMFTLAHEMAHILFGSSAAFDLRELQPADDPTERACNQVAAEFLVPEQLLRKTWPSLNSAKEPFNEIARKFKVSNIVAARRALDLGLISRDAFFGFYNEYVENERGTAARNKGKEAKIKRHILHNLRIGKRFAAAVGRSALEGTTSYSQAFHLTGLYGSSFDKYMAYLGIEGA